MTKPERLEEFGNLWRDYADEDFDSIVVGNQDLIRFLDESYFTAPASTKYHGAYEGGLYDHSKNVFLRLKDLTEKNGLHWQRPISPFIIGMFHDLCKCDQYVHVPNEYEGEPGHYEYNDKILLKGHGDKSVMLLSQFMSLTKEEMLCIRYHMGAYEKDDWQGFDMAIRRYPNVLYSHLADMLASKVDEF